MLMAPCGSGKTTIAAEMVRAARDKGTPVLFIADRIELIEQASARFDHEGIDHGIIQANHWRTDFSKSVQIASIQTLARRRVPLFKLAIIDEAHTLFKAHIQLMKDNPQAFFIGLSASPFTKGLGKHFDALVVAETTQGLIDQGYLVQPRVFAPSAPDVSKIKIRRGDYDETELAEATNQPRLVGDIIDHWFTLARGRPTLAFAVDIKHSMAIVERFRFAGVRAEHLDCYPDNVERHKTIEAFKRGEIQVLSSVDILSKGFDYPGASCAVMARPTKSLILHIQQQGRVLRIHESKSDCVILDHAGNTERLGFITDPLPEILDDGKKKELKPKGREKPLPKKCPKCSFLKEVHVCPNCGFAPQTQAKDVEYVPGTLVEKKAGKIATADKERVYAELCGYAKAKGYKPGWAYHKTKELFGVYPHRHVEPMTPTPETLKLIQHLNIKHHYARGAHA